ncbi:MAG: hypothetical protein FJ098_16880 [Deltaproteobacteria bacterium]|nr:hypothetical protein [Deltaproteobacteria bacterium]
MKRTRMISGFAWWCCLVPLCFLAPIRGQAQEPSIYETLRFINLLVNERGIGLWDGGFTGFDVQPLESFTALHTASTGRYVLFTGEFTSHWSPSFHGLVCGAIDMKTARFSILKEDWMTDERIVAFEAEGRCGLDDRTVQIVVGSRKDAERLVKALRHLGTLITTPDRNIHLFDE